MLRDVTRFITFVTRFITVVNVTTLEPPRKKCIPSDRDVLLGSLAGALHEVIVDEKDKKEKVTKRVFQLQDSKDPISSVYQHQASPGHRMVLMATSKRLYVFSGKGGLETMFAMYTSPGTPIFVQSPCCLWCVLPVRRMAGAQTCRVFFLVDLSILCTSLQHLYFVSNLSCSYVLFVSTVLSRCMWQLKSQAFHASQVFQAFC